MFQIKAPNWADRLGPLLASPQMVELHRKVVERYGTEPVAPKFGDIFRAFELCDYDQVSVVVIGQDPYHTPGVATGVAFGVANHARIPPSLENIFAEIASIYGARPTDRTLYSWARQGVLLLNTVLTVRCGAANSHKDLGWDYFVGQVIEHHLTQINRPVAWLLMGKPAQQLVTRYFPHPEHERFDVAHPSPYSAASGFFGKRVFDDVNRFLASRQVEPVDWLAV